MALFKSVSTKGTTATYWIVFQQIQNKGDNFATKTVLMAGYVSEAVSKAVDAKGKRTGLKENVVLQPVRVPATAVAMADIYTAVKTVPAFAGATDC